MTDKAKNPAGRTVTINAGPARPIQGHPLLELLGRAEQRARDAAVEDVVGAEEVASGNGVHSRIEASIPALRSYAMELLHNREDADDLVHDCLVRALGKLAPTGTGKLPATAHTMRDDADVRAWLFDIMRNSQQLRRARIRLKRQNSDLVSEQDVQNSSDSPSPEAAAPPLRMGETETIQAAAELLSRVYPEKAVTKALQDLAANAAREMTGRATAEPRLKWEKDALPDEDPATFAWRAYQAEAKDGTLHRGLIGQEDEALAVKLANWLRTHKMPEGIDIPTKPEWNTRQLEKLGIAASSNDDPAALATLRLYEVARKRRERVATPG